MIYLDNSATTRPLPAVVGAVNSALTEAYFNPSSAYAPAVEVERRVEQYRLELARALGVTAGELYYTSGATEANNIAIFGTLAKDRPQGRLITTKVEHPSVFDVFQHLQKQGSDVFYLDVDEHGSARLDQLEAILTKDTSFVSIMHVNNETGAVNDIAAIYAMMKRKAPGALLHVDGVQAFCKLPFVKVPCDLYSISGHKFHATKGVGALYVRKGVRFTGGFIGGGQERGMRSGTTNTPGIFGMGAALEGYTKNQKEWVANMRACKLRLAAHLRAMPDTFINGPLPEDGAPHILNASFRGVRGEVLLHALAQQGILVSTGSACSSHKKGRNRILCAMGLEPALQEGAIRFSLCPENTLSEMDAAAQAISENIAQLRRFQRR